MDVSTAIQARRAYRSLAPVEINQEMIKELAKAASLAASCFNKQPWRFVFVYEKEALKKMHGALSKGNEWAYDASMIIAVAAKKEDDCVIKDGREYYLFDTGMAAAHLILRATELGLVAHPIAGFDPEKVRAILGIPADLTVITLINVGKHSEKISPRLSSEQAKGEKERPPRKPLGEFAFHNRYGRGA
ncbi:MAG: nitroreductase [Candidatus Edwardsbacteria bacterium RIFOXYD12_FULL_50_11]|uniref:Nitroreductase n=1 Tax=Candidatus Edwardsbacteria bacterium GWF2_54_11 TaxID=1817851 RepID=A0A1F5R4Y2_9BACT|nr:MAG: nitroreductase [Candidatus Edwardsbacteria bacterium RifOxyC12_full_54_24]OGF07385.1 MAG: nitroreductase [Candidatus Edwardsbacteria bacterium RifOxyA12_full_54_48]OGF09459.1 MAG: nitroreductase [Candidatus Edwardsbacteria bacterium GWF2_54_11]OGF09637.1 MAG: nitroreductase [Candidatus Edwardsbacteria bacterium GWE2_54_12]OGF18080.1 MAG: nitroreductase [Candidatus Edwardsbacteria bacterium RIFOXYD12_FULL_50_11]OGJ19676.1 MAG: nitroreductase [Candidatus Edwardsbacteria bacterium RifOxyB